MVNQQLMYGTNEIHISTNYIYVAICGLHPAAVFLNKIHSCNEFSITDTILLTMVQTSQMIACLKSDHQSYFIREYLKATELAMKMLMIATTYVILTYRTQILIIALCISTDHMISLIVTLFWKTIILGTIFKIYLIGFSLSTGTDEWTYQVLAL